MSELDEVDVAVVARLRAGSWQVDDLPDRALADVGSVVREVDGVGDDGVGDDAVLAMLSVGDDFALLVRNGADGGPARLLLSDASAALEWDLAASALDLLGLDAPDEEDDAVPAGDLALLDDLDLSATDLADLLDEEEHPDDVLVSVADELGFADVLEELLDDSTDGADSDDSDDSEDDLDELEDDDLLDDLDDEDDLGVDLEDDEE